MHLNYSKDIYNYIFSIITLAMQWIWPAARTCFLVRTKKMPRSRGSGAFHQTLVMKDIKNMKAMTWYDQ